MAFDPDQFLSDKKKSGTPGAFDPDTFLKSESGAGGVEPAFLADIPATEATAPSAFAVPQLPVSGYGPGVGSQLAQISTGQTAHNIGRIMQPYTTAASKVMGAYAANPMTKLAPDLAAAVHGIPPPYAASQAIGATQGAYNVGRQIATGGGRVPGPVAPTAAEIASSQIPRSQRTSEIAARQAAIETESMANRSMMQKIAANKVVQMAAPALNTVGRVAGPAGMAMNLYGARQMVQDAQLGERLAQGQGQDAERSFRQMNVQYGDAFRNTVTAQQARDILASGSTRDITAFGGAAFLRQRAGQ
jgi:hypothetical protein